MSFHFYVIGAGSIGTRHFNNLTALGVDVTHLPWRGLHYDALITSLTQAKGNAGVVIATATKIRLPLIRDIAATGAALYIEKPLAYRATDVATIFDLPIEIQHRSVAGFMMRYNPLIQHLAQHKMPNLFRAQFEIGHDVTQWRQNWTFAGSYAADPDGGGVLLDLCHEIDLAMLLCDGLLLNAVTSVAHPEFDHVDIQSHLTLTSDAGTISTVAMDYLAPKMIRRGSLVGLDHQYDYDLMTQRLTITTLGEHQQMTFPLDRNDMFMGIMADFIALAQGHTPKNPIAPRLDSTRKVCHMIAQAWESRHFSGTLKARLT